MQGTKETVMCTCTSHDFSTVTTNVCEKCHNNLLFAVARWLLSLLWLSQKFWSSEKKNGLGLSGGQKFLEFLKFRSMQTLFLENFGPRENNGPTAKLCFLNAILNWTSNVIG